MKKWLCWIAAALLIASISGSGAVAQTRKTAKSKKKPAKTVPKPPPVTPEEQAEAATEVNVELEKAAGLPVENVAGLIPFFEQLYRLKSGRSNEGLHILHYGDSHTAADEWTGFLRNQFQTRFGDGGAGYSLAGKPYNSYRRLDLQSNGSTGWYSDGLAGRSGDGLYGLGGVSITTSRRGEWVTLTANCGKIELYFLKQPRGGTLEFSDNGEIVDKIATAGDTGPGYFSYKAEPGLHRFQLRTLEAAPVRLLGWVTESGKGVTYETLGINGAQASIVFNWDEHLLSEHLSKRNPALIVLAYGTNEAGQNDLSEESYRDMFYNLILRFRKAVPTASILVVGPPDRYHKTRTGWEPVPGVDRIVEAQRAAALATGCAFWDLRAKMGGKGSMRRWVQAGLAQYDYVHLTAEGYHRIGGAVFQDLMSQYDTFVRIREQVLGQNTNGQTGDNH
jgi:lysophospholipase L1-like esterase